VQSLKSGEAKELFRGYGAQYLPTGHLVYLRGRNVVAVPFDLDRLEVTGRHVPVVYDVRRYAISDSGTLAYIPATVGGAAAGRSLVWVNREGKEEPLSAPPNDYLWFRISPDGKRVALAAQKNLWIWDLVHGTRMRLTLEEGTDNDFPLWTPDGKRVLFASGRENAAYGVYWKAADGTGEVEKLASSSAGRVLLPCSWSNDGKTLVLSEQILTPLQSDIGLLSMEGPHVNKPLLQGKYVENGPRISPDGRWMAYASNESGKSEVWVCSFPDVNKGKWQVSTSGGNSPLWSPDGRELFYYDGDAVISVQVKTEPTFKAGKSTVLFQGAYSGAAGADSTFWDISPDGKRFLMMKEAGTGAGEGPRKINIVLNWFEELKARVATK